MFLTDLSIKRPVVASVMSLVLVIFGLVTFQEIPTDELPDASYSPGPLPRASEAGSLMADARLRDAATSAGSGEDGGAVHEQVHAQFGSFV